MTHSEIIKVRCPQCGHVFEVDLARPGAEQIIYREDGAPRAYRLRCPVDHTFFVVEAPAPGSVPSVGGMP